mmetsp:Transcript_18699/g.44004  ORF Transcript_18699/g.44004 Transcript_18699/m.44004 type:complete len:138 (-) Transcript_18699:76-489(-)
MALYTLYIVNKAGGLIYNKDLSPVPKLSGNEYLTLASTFHGLHAISSQLAPVVSGGIERLDAATFSLQCFQTPTGIKFFCTARPGTTGLDDILKVVYGLFADYVLKNPFYELDMPIRCDLFDRALEGYVKSLFGDAK